MVLGGLLCYQQTGLLQCLAVVRGPKKKITIVLSAFFYFSQNISRVEVFEHHYSLTVLQIFPCIIVFVCLAMTLAGLPWLDALIAVIDKTV